MYICTCTCIVHVHVHHVLRVIYIRGDAVTSIELTRRVLETKLQVLCCIDLKRSFSDDESQYNTILEAEEPILVEEAQYEETV